MMQLRYELEVLNWKPENALWRVKQFFMERGYRVISEDGNRVELRRGGLAASLFSFHPSRMEQTVSATVAGTQGVPTRVALRYEILPRLHTVTKTVKSFWDVECRQLSLFMQRGYIDAHLDRDLEAALWKDIRRIVSPYSALVALAGMGVVLAAAELWLIFRLASN